MKKRLSKALAGAGIASRRKCEELIFEGKVKVNGQVVKVPQHLVELERDHVEIKGKRIAREEKKVYYVLNKPAGYLCTHRQEETKGRVIYDLFEEDTSRLFSVGRLDKETTGLLLITNDGEFANRIMHPSFGIQKEYVAKVSEEIMPEHLYALSKGALVEGVLVKPVSVKKVRRGTVKVVVGDGKKREVRLLLEHAGLEVRELCRVRIGSLTLGKLPLGAHRTLTQDEIDATFPSPWGHVFASDQPA